MFLFLEVESRGIGGGAAVRLWRCPRLSPSKPSKPPPLRPRLRSFPSLLRPRLRSLRSPPPPRPRLEALETPFVLTSKPSNPPPLRPRLQPAKPPSFVLTFEDFEGPPPFVSPSKPSKPPLSSLSKPSKPLRPLSHPCNLGFEGNGCSPGPLRFRGGCLFFSRRRPGGGSGQKRTENRPRQEMGNAAPAAERTWRTKSSASGFCKTFKTCCSGCIATSRNSDGQLPCVTYGSQGRYMSWLDLAEMASYHN